LTVGAGYDLATLSHEYFSVRSRGFATNDGVGFDEDQTFGRGDGDLLFSGAVAVTVAGEATVAANTSTSASGQ
jgi:hypothetical protein